jgi:acetyltransferase-like isoleucine patch superfamily enzyme
MNTIHETANIHPNVILGDFNMIGRNVEIIILSENDFNSKIVIGDNNIIADNTRIILTDGVLTIGDWNVIHNNCLLLIGSKFEIKNNCWVGQSSVLDGTGGLSLGNGVRIGMNSQIWSHAVSGELIEGCKLFIKQETIICDDVWLVGSCLVSSGVTIEKRVIALLGSVINSDFPPNSVISGNPAQIRKGIKLYGRVGIDKKFLMMLDWCHDFAKNNVEYRVYKLDENSIKITGDDDILNVVKFKPKFLNNNESYFILEDKTMIKKNTNLERQLYRFLFAHKARFNPS